MYRVLKPRLFGALFLFAILFACVHTTFATTVIMPTDANMIIGSRAIIRGRVLNVESALDPQSNRIFTYITVRVQEVFKGQIKERKIILKQEGGQIEGRGSMVFGTPQFTLDQNVLLYLESWADGSLRVHQYFLGKFDIVTDPASNQQFAVRSEMSEGVVVLQNHSQLASGEDITNRLELSAYLQMLRTKIATHAEQSRLFEQRYYSNIPMNARPVEYAELIGKGRLQPQWTYISSAHPRWFEPDSGQPVVFRVNPAGAPNQQINNDIAAAMNAWSTIPGCAMRMAVGTNTSECFPDLNNNTIIFNNCDGRWSAGGGGCQGVLALGGLGWTGNTRVINGVSFVQANQGFVSFNPYAACNFGISCNVQEITTHELGHALGLGHSADLSATMYGIAHFDGRCASTRPDDQAAMVFIYPGQGGGGGPLAISTNSPLPNGNIGSAYSQTIIATGGTTPYTWSVISGSLPAGLTLNTQSGVISGTPTTAATSNFTLQVRDNAQATAQRAFSITVNTASSALDAQFVSWTVPTSVQPGASFQVNVKFNNTGTTPWVSSLTIDYYLASQNPALNTTWGGNGVPLSGFPTQPGQQLDLTFQAVAPATPGNYNFQWQMYQNGGVTFFGQTTPNVVIQVGSGGPPPLSITTTGLASGTVGTAYSQALAATGGTAPYSWSVTAGALPAGLTLNALSGVISGTPTAAATSTFTVQVRDAAQATTTRQLSIQVNPATPPPLSVTTTSLPNGTVGVAYSQTLAASGGTTPYSWSLTTGSLPAGLTLNASTGAISGTPTAAGNSSFTVQVRDSAQATAPRQLSIFVNSASPLAITTTSLPSGAMGTAYSQTLAATGGTTPYTWILAGGTLPAGLTLSQNGTISGTPTATGTSSFSIQVRDAVQVTVSAGFSIQISGSAGTNNATFAAQTVPRTMAPGQTYSVTVTMNNTGSTSWTPSTYKLGSQTPQDNLTWGVNRATLSQAVPSGGQGSFTFNITAPTAAGAYNFQWQMIQEGVGFFGETSTLVPVIVTSSNCPGGGTDNSQFMLQDLRVGANNPGGTVVTNNHVTAGGRYTYNISFKNTGTSYWNIQNGYQLGTQNPSSNTTWGRDKIEIGNCVVPGSEPTPPFGINIIAPAVAKTYNLQWQIYKDGNGIGVMSTNMAMTVDPDPNDRDNDGIPNGLEAAVGKNPDLKDNAVLENSTLFINQMYRDFLYRERTVGDGNYWVDQINSGVTRGEVVARFFEAQEFYLNKALLIKLYQQCFGRLPDYEGIRYWLDEVASGRQTRDQIANAFVNSDEFRRKYGTLTNDQFVGVMYQNALNRQPNQTESQTWVAQLNGGASRGTVAVSIAGLAEYDLRVTVQVQIVEMYLVMLMRMPTSAENTYWLQQWANVNPADENQKRQQRISMANTIMNGSVSQVVTPYSYRERFY
jgi:hypothetical protein